MAADLSSIPEIGIRTQICGDAHLANFGAYASPERRMIFDVNDFDETLPGPWEWDVKRLVASLVVAGRNNTYSAADRKSIAVSAAAEYRTAMHSFAAMPVIDLWYSHVDLDTFLPRLKTAIPPADFKELTQDLTKARGRDNVHAFSKLTRMVGGTTQIVSDPPLTVPLSELYPKLKAQQVRSTVQEILRGYGATLSDDRRQLLAAYRLVDVARRVVGVGSVGTRSWVLLFLGQDGADPLVLQAKEAQTSVLEEFVGGSEYRNHGERVVNGQRWMQAVSDIFLGWNRIREPDGTLHDYYVRQLRDWKWSPDFTTLSIPAMTVWGRLCAWTLARGHARSGDSIAVAAYLGQNDSFDRAMASFGEGYADQNERDYDAFKNAVNAGKVEAVTGV